MKSRWAKVGLASGGWTSGWLALGARADRGAIAGGVGVGVWGTGILGAEVLSAEVSGARVSGARVSGTERLGTEEPGTIAPRSWATLLSVAAVAGEEPTCPGEGGNRSAAA